MIKCGKKDCNMYNKRKKHGCSRQADPHTCKGYIITIMNIQMDRILSIESIVNKALATEGTDKIHAVLQDIFKE